MFRELLRSIPSAPDRGVVPPQGVIEWIPKGTFFDHSVIIRCCNLQVPIVVYGERLVLNRTAWLCLSGRGGLWAPLMKYSQARCSLVNAACMAICIGKAPTVKPWFGRRGWVGRDIW
jgi:hypothetical protein